MKTDDWLESEEFYNAMQGYRWAPMHDQREVVAHFENVKRKIREKTGSERAELEKVAGDLNRIRARVEGVLWPNCGMATGE